MAVESALAHNYQHGLAPGMEGFEEPPCPEALEYAIKVQHFPNIEMISNVSYDDNLGTSAEWQVCTKPFEYYDEFYTAPPEIEFRDMLEAWRALE